MASLPLTLLALGRTAVGSGSFLLPGLTSSALFYPLPASSLLAGRLWGSRDALLGILLWTAKTPEGRRRALLAGAAVDALDVVAATVGYLQGDIGAAPALAFGGGAVSFLALAALGWRGAGLGAARVVKGG